MHSICCAPSGQLLLAAALLLLLLHSGVDVCASRVPRSLAAANSSGTLTWQTYTANLRHEGVKTKGTASIVFLNSTTAVAMLDLKEAKGFDVLTVQLYNTSLGPSSPTVVTLFNDTDPATTQAHPDYLLFNVKDGAGLHKLLDSGRAGVRVTCKNYPAATFSKPLTSGTTSVQYTQPAAAAPMATSSTSKLFPSDFSTIVQYVQVLLQAAEVLVTVGLPAVASTPIHFISRATLSFLGSLAVHERLAGLPISDASRFPPLLRDARTANQAYDTLFSTASSCTAYLSTVYSSTDIVDCSTASGVNRQPYFSYIEHTTKRVMVSIRGSDAVLDWSTNADATTTVISPSVGAHKGMFTSARQLLDGLSGKLNIALAANPGYTLSFVGHSLGAGVGALAAYMVKNSVSSGALLSAAAPGVTATCFSTPPVLTMEAAASTESYITTLLVEDDMVPRLSLGNTDAFIGTVDKQVLPFVQHPDAASKIFIDLDYASYQVSPSISIGSDVLYQMYSPGTMLQLTSGGRASADDSCLGPMLTGKGPYDRLKTLLLKINMINDHSLDMMIRCLAAHL